MYRSTHGISGINGIQLYRLPYMETMKSVLGLDLMTQPLHHQDESGMETHHLRLKSMPDDPSLKPSLLHLQYEQKLDG
ncbi:Uncharacterised protein [Acinetobacter baumannii]|nr:Uncharacterised protein [Acinetobacter baumannii]